MTTTTPATTPATASTAAPAVAGASLTAAEAAQLTSRRQGRRAMFLRRFLSTPTGVIAAALLTALVVLTVIGPIIWADAAETTNALAARQGPSSAHPLGTDRLGRDILARVLSGTRPSILLTFYALVIGVAGGTALGVAPLALPKRLGRMTSASVNVAVGFPGLLLAFIFSVIVGIGAKGAVLGVGIAMIPMIARLTQTVAYSVDGRDFIAAARVAGVNRVKVIFTHVLPNIAEPLVINAANFAGAGLVAFSSLSFLGLGVQKPDYDWGVLLVEGVEEIYTNPASAFGPGVAIILAGLAFSLTGESIAKVLTNQHASIPPRKRGAGTGSPEPLADAGAGAVLSVRDLRITAYTPTGEEFQPVRGVSFDVHAGETVGVVGESGSGKSLTALAVAGLLQHPLSADADRIRFGEIDMLGDTTGRARRELGMRMSFVFQDPMTALNPSLRIGTQLAEVVEVHHDEPRSAAWARVEDKLAEVGIPQPAERAHQFPHEFSGGMRQRAVIAMGLMGTPQLILADEPTTALDVTVQKQVLDLLDQVRREEHLALLMISHDLLVVGQVCDRVMVMYAGRVVEEGPSEELLQRPAHPYTAALLGAVPDMDTDRNQPLSVVPGQPPDPRQGISGCAFAPRCANATELCREQDPELEPVSPTSPRTVACWVPEWSERAREVPDPAGLAGSAPAVPR